jgi:hypothetical protein
MQREDLMRAHYRFLKRRRDLILLNIGQAILVAIRDCLVQDRSLCNSPLPFAACRPHGPTSHRYGLIRSLARHPLLIGVHDLL